MCNPSDHNARCRRSSWHHRGLSGFHKPSKLHRWTTTRKLSWGCFSNFKLITGRTRPRPPNPNFGCPCARFVDPAFGGKASERNRLKGSKGVVGILFVHGWAPTLLMSFSYGVRRQNLLGRVIILHSRKAQSSSLFDVFPYVTFYLVFIQAALSSPLSLPLQLLLRLGGHSK